MNFRKCVKIAILKINMFIYCPIYDCNKPKELRINICDCVDDCWKDPQIQANPDECDN